MGRRLEFEQFVKDILERSQDIGLTSLPGPYGPANDLAVLLLRDQLAGVLGFDPLTAAGMARWGAELLTIYAGGLAATPGGGPGRQPGPEAPGTRDARGGCRPHDS